MRIIIAIAAFLLAAGAANAAEIKALISTAMKAPFEEIAAQFEKATGHKVSAAYGPTGGLAKRIADGETADMVVLGGTLTPELMKQGKLAAGSNTDIARGMIGAGVVKGAPKPDISSEAAFKAALLSAKSIAVTDPPAAAAAACSSASCSRRWTSPRRSSPSCATRPAARAAMPARS
jgi:molybdate transport system substrate-binding protein